MAKQNEFDFETSLKELTDIVEEMEKGNLSLEKSLKKFERGVTLAQHCQEILKQAEQKVQMLSNSSNNLEDYNESASS